VAGLKSMFHTDVSPMEKQAPKFFTDMVNTLKLSIKKKQSTDNLLRCNV